MVTNPRNVVLFAFLIFGAATCGGSREFEDTPQGGKGGSLGSGGARGGAKSSGGAAGASGDGNAAGAESGGALATGGASGEGGELGAGAAGAVSSGGQGAQAGESTTGAVGGELGAGGASGSAGASGAGASDAGTGGGGAEPFQCGDSLPALSFPNVLTSTGTPPTPAGGAITEGVYVLTQVVVYGTYSSVPADVFELRGGYLHSRHTTYSSSGSALTGYEQVGTYATTGAAMAVDVVACGLGSGPTLWKFTATSNKIVLFINQNPTTWVQTFERQP